MLPNHYIPTPKEINELYSIALKNTNDPKRARACLEAYLAGLDRNIPKKVEYAKKENNYVFTVSFIS